MFEEFKGELTAEQKQDILITPETTLETLKNKVDTKRDKLEQAGASATFMTLADTLTNAIKSSSKKACEQQS